MAIITADDFAPPLESLTSVVIVTVFWFPIDVRPSWYTYGMGMSD